MSGFWGPQGFPRLFSGPRSVAAALLAFPLSVHLARPLFPLFFVYLILFYFISKSLSNKLQKQTQRAETRNEKPRRRGLDEAQQPRLDSSKPLFCFTLFPFACIFIYFISFYFFYFFPFCFLFKRLRAPSRPPRPPAPGPLFHASSVS